MASEYFDPTVRLQETDFIYCYDMVYFTCVGISSLEGKVYFVGLYWISILQCTAQKAKNLRLSVAVEESNSDFILKIRNKSKKVDYA
jgi:hypothetical protein